MQRLCKTYAQTVYNQPELVFGIRGFPADNLRKTLPYERLGDIIKAYSPSLSLAALVVGCATQEGHQA